MLCGAAYEKAAFTTTLHGRLLHTGAARLPCLMLAAFFYLATGVRQLARLGDVARTNAHTDTYVHHYAYARGEALHTLRSELQRH